MTALLKISSLTVTTVLLASLVDTPPPVLSEHDLEEINAMQPPDQATRLLERAIGGYKGAVEEIERRADGWIGKFTSPSNLRVLSETAYFSSDLRVRAAALEIWRVEAGYRKSASTVDQLIEAAETNPERLYFYLSHLGIQGHSGIEAERVLKILLLYAAKSDGPSRAAAINGLGLLGTEATIAPLIEIFHNDSSADLRERSACNLVDSGLLSRESRLKAVPELIRMNEEASLDAQTRKWLYQALREITHQSLPDDQAAWSNWFDSSKRNP